MLKMEIYRCNFALFNLLLLINCAQIPSCCNPHVNIYTGLAIIKLSICNTITGNLPCIC